MAKNSELIQGRSSGSEKRKNQCSHACRAGYALSLVFFFVFWLNPLWGQSGGNNNGTIQYKSGTGFGGDDNFFFNSNGRALELVGDTTGGASGVFEIKSFSLPFNINALSSGSNQYHAGGIVLQRSRGDYWNPQTVNEWDYLGNVLMGGFDGSGYTNGAYGGSTITASAAQTWGSTQHGTKLVISNTLNGQTAPQPMMVFDPNGNVVVEGVFVVENMISAKQVKVTSSGWPDYVFKKEYTPMPLADVESYIQAHQHLPGVPSGQEVVENGVDVGKMQAKLLEKVEELTLYLIEVKRENQQLKQRLESLEETAESAR